MGDMDVMEPPEPSAEAPISTDAVLSESVERVRSSRQLLDEIEQRLRRGEQLLGDDPSAAPSA
jgi:hypothetical protein